MNRSYVVDPKAPPALNVPESSCTVDVRVIDTYVFQVHDSATAFFSKLTDAISWILNAVTPFSI